MHGGDPGGTQEELHQCKWNREPNRPMSSRLMPQSPLQVDLDDFTVENALFRNFDRIVRHQLDPVWHRVGNKTKKLVADLTQLRQLLT
jgi:hypothetical protein